MSETKPLRSEIIEMWTACLGGKSEINLKQVAAEVAATFELTPEFCQRFATEFRDEIIYDLGNDLVHSRRRQRGGRASTSLVRMTGAHVAAVIAERPRTQCRGTTAGAGAVNGQNPQLETEAGYGQEGTERHRSASVQSSADP